MEDRRALALRERERELTAHEHNYSMMTFHGQSLIAAIGMFETLSTSMLIRLRFFCCSSTCHIHGRPWCYWFVVACMRQIGPRCRKAHARLQCELAFPTIWLRSATTKGGTLVSLTCRLGKFDCAAGVCEYGSPPSVRRSMNAQQCFLPDKKRRGG